MWCLVFYVNKHVFRLHTWRLPAVLPGVNLQNYPPLDRRVARTRGQCLILLRLRNDLVGRHSIYFSVHTGNNQEITSLGTAYVVIRRFVPLVAHKIIHHVKLFVQHHFRQMREITPDFESALVEQLFHHLSPAVPEEDPRVASTQQNILCGSVQFANVFVGYESKAWIDQLLLNPKDASWPAVFTFSWQDTCPRTQSLLKDRDSLLKREVSEWRTVPVRREAFAAHCVPQVRTEQQYPKWTRNLQKDEDAWTRQGNKYRQSL